MRAERLALGVAIALAMTSASAALYRWVDERGIVQYSDKPPDGKAKGGVEMSKGGTVVKKLDPTLTPEAQKAKDEEEARRKAEERQAILQRRADHALLQSFTNVGEIDRKRDREMQSIQTLIVNLKLQERNVSERLDDIRKRLKADAKAGTPGAAGLLDDLAGGEAELKLIRSNIERRQLDIGTTRSHYDALKTRYLELRQPDATPSRLAPAVAAPSPAKK